MVAGSTREYALHGLTHWRQYALLGLVATVVELHVVIDHIVLKQGYIMRRGPESLRSTRQVGQSFA